VGLTATKPPLEVFDFDPTVTHPHFPHNDLGAAFSPNGHRMVFASDRNVDPPVCCDTDMVVMNADGTAQTVRDLGLTAPHDFAWGTAPLISAKSPIVGPLPQGRGMRRPAVCRFLPATLSPCKAGSFGN
jgi:hypothetical protein